MLNKGNHITSCNPGIVYRKATFNRCFVAVFVLLISLIQFSVVANSHHDQGIIKNATVHTPTPSVQAVLVAAGVPSESFPLVPEMELLEDDETKNDHSAYWLPVNGNHGAGELFQLTSLRSRFMQINSSLHGRTAIPYFILYHSWKSYLA